MSTEPRIPTTKLSSGFEMPVLAFGTGTAWYKADRFSAPNPDMVAMIKNAIAAGYRHIDTAEAYGTEAEVGQAIKESGVPRESLFVVSKVLQTLFEGGPDDAEAALDNTLQRLGLDYLDLYMLHSPYFTKDNKYSEEAVARVWRHLEAAQRSGKVRSIGISNFHKSHVQNLLKTAEIRPVVNQFQLNPYLQGAPEFTKWLQSEGIAVSSWMGLAPITWLKGKHLEPTLNDLSKKYGVSPASILIRWQLDQKITVLNTTKKTERFAEFFAALDLALDQEDAKKITEIGQQTHLRVPLSAIYDGGEMGPYEY